MGPLHHGAFTAEVDPLDVVNDPCGLASAATPVVTAADVGENRLLAPPNLDFYQIRGVDCAGAVGP